MNVTTTVTEAALRAAKPLAGGEVLQARFGPVMWLAFNRPKALNAMTHAMEDALTAVFRAVNHDAGVRALVLTGLPGVKPAFMAGADMGDLDAVTTPEEAVASERSAEEVTAALEAVRAPTLAAMTGPCVGMGALVAASCDVRVAASSLRFGFPIARTVGNGLSALNYARLTALVGPARTKEMVFSARLLDAATLESAGALRETVPDDADLLPRAEEIAADLATLAPLTLWNTKETLRRMRDAAIAGVEDQDLLMACYGSKDYHTAIRAFATRTRPVFTGR